ncbi:MAG TPA: hypothetical protein VGC13_04490 [Longimicrobium sp.]|jgi:hypothetical protein|uniref:hypothetical protein n=1 Tax=Longimicrobium sp. TaxID=2029185 RepID=UPI002ED98261
MSASLHTLVLAFDATSRTLPNLPPVTLVTYAMIWLMVGALLAQVLPEDASPIERLFCLVILWIIIPMAVCAVYLLGFG